MRKIFFEIIALLIVTACSDNNTKTTNENASKKDSILEIKQNSTENMMTLDTSTQKQKSISQQIDNDTLLIATGTEPGWILTLYKTKFHFVVNYGKDTIEVKTTIDTKQFPVEYKSKNLTFRLEKKKCIAISGEEMNISAHIIFDGKDLHGCAKLLKQ